MGKKKTTDQRILLMTDSASDISDADLLEGGIVMLPIPIAMTARAILSGWISPPGNFTSG